MQRVWVYLQERGQPPFHVPACFQALAAQWLSVPFPFPPCFTPGASLIPSTPSFLCVGIPLQRLADGDVWKCRPPCGLCLPPFLKEMKTWSHCMYFLYLERYIYIYTNSRISNVVSGYSWGSGLEEGMRGSLRAGVLFLILVMKLCSLMMEKQALLTTPHSFSL